MLKEAQERRKYFVVLLSMFNVLRVSEIRFWQEYVEPLDSSSHSDLGAKVPSMETDHILLPLGENTLTNNTGLPIIVVISKVSSCILVFLAGIGRKHHSTLF